MNKNVILVVVLVLVIGSIVYLESLKPSETVGVRKSISLSSVDNVSGNVSLDAVTAARIAAKSKLYPPATELVSPDGYINSAPFNLSDYIGKDVILVDFWTYSCINCQRTLPYLNSWYAKYHDKGLLIVGVHSPEFDFEKDPANVAAAVKKYGVMYPVVLDNEHQTWSAYQNLYWPHEYLIDIDGFMVHDHIGEGDYDQSELEIQKLLAERASVLGLNVSVDVPLTTETGGLVGPDTDEIYLGYGYSRGQLGNSEGWVPGQVVNYTMPSSLSPGDFYLGGAWLNNNDNMESVGNSTLVLDYTASTVNIVAGGNSSAIVNATVDGVTSSVIVGMHDLYTVGNSSYGSHQVTLHVPPGVEVYTFTFG